MDPTGAFARRFPLVARPRPTCHPLTRRVAALAERARHAAQTGALTEACAVHNQAALIASDCGLPDLARTWCRRQATLHLRDHPLDARHARHALEPLTNLARLHIREGHGELAFDLIDTLFTAVSARTTSQVDGVEIPTDLTDSPPTHRELRSWLWAVLLATGARALAVAGRWTDAHTQLRRYNGVGHRMLDGRQVAVIAHAVTGDTRGALALLADTTPADPWENAVTACLTVACHPTPGAGTPEELLDRYHHLDPTTSGIGVFHTRLGLSFVDALTGTDDPTMREAADRIATVLIAQTLRAPDGYAARDILAHDRCRDQLTAIQHRDLTSQVQHCGLQLGTIPPPELTELTTALTHAENVITQPYAAKPGPRGRPATSRGSSSPAISARQFAGWISTNSGDPAAMLTHATDPAKRLGGPAT